MSVISVEIAAQMIMDKYYQSYAPNGAFFKHADFLRDTILVYKTLVDDQFRTLKRQAKASEGFSAIEVSPDMIVEETLDVSDKNGIIAVTSQNIYSFANDAISTGLQYIRKVEGECESEIVKISFKDAWMYEKAPKTSKVFCYVKGTNSIVFVNKNCIPKKILVGYIPNVEIGKENCIINEDMLPAVMTSVLQLYLGAKNGNVIQKANDGNLNATPQNQANNNLK